MLPGVSNSMESPFVYMNVGLPIAREYIHISQSSGAEMDPEANNTEDFTSISSLILFVFTCKGAHLTDSTENFGNL